MITVRKAPGFVVVTETNHGEIWIPVTDARRVAASIRAAAVVCSVPGCACKIARAGLCRKHFDAKRGTVRRTRPAAPCVQQDCGRLAACRGLCWPHYYEHYHGRIIRDAEAEAETEGARR